MMSIGLNLGTLVGISRAIAAESVQLTYFDQQITLSLKTLEVFAQTGVIADPDAQTFLQALSTDPRFDPQLLSAPVKIDPQQIPGDIFAFDTQERQFLLSQINEILGSPSRVYQFNPLEIAFQEATKTDQEFSILELLETYPKSPVRLNLNKIAQVQEDVSLFLERLRPLLQSKPFLNDLLCEGQLALASPVGPIASEYMQRSQAGLSPILVASRHLYSWPSQTQSFSPNRLVIKYGPFSRTIPVKILERLSTTGQLPLSERLLLKLANVSPKDVQNLLNKQVQIDPNLLDSLLNRFFGKYVLFKVGQVLHTPSNRSNIEALRASLMQSVMADSRISILELLQNYPTPTIVLEGRQLGRVLRASQTLDLHISSLENFVVEVRSLVAELYCSQ